LEEPQLRQRAIQLGMYPVASKPAEFAAFLKRDAQQWANVIRDAKIPKVE
jgi:tripartite-type tricarboxylate transporter receptor subunit TctC